MTRQLLPIRLSPCIPWEPCSKSTRLRENTNDEHIDYHVHLTILNGRILATHKNSPSHLMQEVIALNAWSLSHGYPRLA